VSAAQTGEGKFFARINGRVVTRTNLRDLEKVIMGEAVPVRGLYVSPNEILAIEMVEITAVDTDGRMRRKNRQLINNWRRRVYLPDEAVMVELKQLVEEQLALRARWEAAVKKLTPMTKEHVQQAQGV